MASIERRPGPAYRVSYGAVPLDQVADQTRLLPLDYVTESRNDIKTEYRAYAEPLIGGPLAQYARLGAAQPGCPNPTNRGR